jgi:hypothetical protein
MAARIGNVLYWLGCAIATLIAIFAAAIYIAEGRTHSDGLFVFAVFMAAAILSWVIGRALQYILSAR